MGAGVVVLRWFFELGSGAFSLWIVLIAVLFWAFLVSIAFLVLWAGMYLFARKTPELPLTPHGRRAGQKVLIGLCAFVTVFTLAREGVFAPYFVFSVSQYKINSTTHMNSHTNSNPDGKWLMSNSVNCHIDCQPSGSTICEAVQTSLACQESDSSDEALLQVDLDVGEDPFCFVPLFKSAEIHFSAKAALHANAYGGAAPSYTIDLEGTIAQEIRGFGSCYRFRQLLGVAVAEQVAQSIRESLN